MVSGKPGAIHNAYRLELDGHSMRRSTVPNEKVDEGRPA